MEQSKIGLLKGKKGLITGIANNLSIAWAIAQIAHEHGAELAFTYPNDALKKRVMPLATELGIQHVYECDVAKPESMDKLFNNIKDDFKNLDFIVHAIAYADKNDLRGKYLDTSLESFSNTLNISCYSLTALAQRAHSLMNDGGSIITLTYHGAQKVIPCYNIMGIAKAALEASVRYLAYDLGSSNIRVNAISAGPVRTIAANSIGDFKTMYDIHQNTSPLKRNTTQQDVAGAALYLLSNLANGVTGEIHYVDNGYSILGMSLKE